MHLFLDQKLVTHVCLFYFQLLCVYYDVCFVCFLECMQWKTNDAIVYFLFVFHDTDIGLCRYNVILSLRFFKQLLIFHIFLGKVVKISRYDARINLPLLATPCN